MRGLYRIMFRVLATETLVRQAPRFYDMFYHGGRAQVTEATAGRGAVRYSDCRGFDYLVWQDLMGGAQAGFEATGARNLVLRADEGGKDGDAGLLVSVRWAV